MSCVFCDKGLLKDNFQHRIVKQRYSTAILHINQFYYGRALVIFNQHEEDLSNLKEFERKDFWEEAIEVGLTVQKATEADRINYALLGNREYHLHWHVIPRYINEPNFTTTPWHNEGEKTLSEPEMQNLIRTIRNNLE